MGYNDMALSLSKDAPVGKGGICPVCGGKLDGVVWAMCGNETEERCTNCCSLISLKNGVVDKKMEKYKPAYDRFIEKKNNDLKLVENNLNNLKTELRNLNIFKVILGKKDTLKGEIRDAMYKLNYIKNRGFSIFKEVEDD